MESFESDDGHVIVRLDRGDMVLESIERACTEHAIDTGAVVTGIGTVSTLHIHYVDRTELPDDRADRNVALELQGAWEVTDINGVIADGEPHLHVTAFDGDRTVGGHLETGCEINVLGEVTIRKLSGLSLERRPNEREVSRLQQ
ncbi:PPC domain-containing DNA-binding protein [Halocatena pleomorpha]|uniref:DNA-binding protein n=1 Tax=Halocatena pleomorpha TaxID=1785090 RepID=A0A3P3R9H4_9EURY|nr:PPC domain-containing DNA-binding protein [Halocatena pleomorpha]RRJ30096.1 DNA-binding protein [Halocatena pleomorpha]